MEEKQKKTSSVWRILLIILGVLIIIIGLYLGLAWVLRLVNNGTGSNSTASTTTTTSKNMDKNLVGTWVSDCLVPDQNSPWSEKHQFVIKSDGTAIHTRWSSSGHDCSPETTLDTNYTINIPSADKINLTDTSGTRTLYDIYQISGNTLEFGHGFRNNLPYPSANGVSEASRITSLNDYIVYKKQ